MDAIQIRVINNGKCKLPEYKTENSAGMDLMANLEKSMILKPGQRALIPTGLQISMPVGYEAHVRARSGLALNHGIGLVNGIGTIDSDYRGEIKVIIINHGEKDFVVNHSDRIAQLVINKYTRVEWKKVEALDDTVRGIGGFGHTGIREK